MIASHQHDASVQSTDRGAGPQRTCVGCRQVDQQRAMVRLTTDGALLLVDEGRRRPGRGAYLHARTSCMTRAEKGGFSRSFRRSIPRDSITLIREHILSVRSEGSNE
jgi:predicted RNA-binding protein YlxR (DUF448 family)